MEIFDIIADSVLDSVKLVPFLFLTYLAMEYLEHKTGDKARLLVMRMGPKGRREPKNQTIQQGWKSQNEPKNQTVQEGREDWKIPKDWQEPGTFGSRIGAGPVVGGLLGIVPQCGFSAAASSLYAGRVITLGTLIAIYLSTSDEMLPLLLSEGAPVGMIASILLAKAVVGMAAGLGIDLLKRGKRSGEQRCIHDICEQESCHCENGIFRSALSHTLQITFFILVVTFVLNLVLHFIGEEMLADLILDRPVVAPIVAGVVGLIPNCAGSVVLTQLYLKGAMRMGTLLAGLFVNSGVGLLVLFRVNHDRKENWKIMGLLYGIGVMAGMLIGFAI